MAKMGGDVRYIVLRPDKETTVERATCRQQRDFFPLNAETVEDVWNSFTGLGEYELNVLDTTDQTIDESVTVIQRMLSEGGFRVTAHD